MGHDAQGNLRAVQRPQKASAPVETRIYNALNQLARIEDAQYRAA